MDNKITFLLETDNGKVTTEVSGISAQTLTGLRNDLGEAVNVNCGKPVDRDIAKPCNASTTTPEDTQSIWLYRVYHNSVVDGPGRRSVIQVAGCSIRCPGCYVPETHDRSNGRRVPITLIVKEIVANRSTHDGVTILGGEPFDQPGPIAELVSRLKESNIHIAVYSGYTMDDVIKKRNPSLDYTLSHIDLLVDGPFVLSLNENAGEYRGSSNQQIISCTS